MTSWFFFVLAEHLSLRVIDWPEVLTQVIILAIPDEPPEPSWLAQYGSLLLANFGVTLGPDYIGTWISNWMPGLAFWSILPLWIPVYLGYRLVAKVCGWK
jgi:hypothetical protein